MVHFLSGSWPTPQKKLPTCCSHGLSKEQRRTLFPYLRLPTYADLSAASRTGLRWPFPSTRRCRSGCPRTLASIYLEFLVSVPVASASGTLNLRHASCRHSRNMSELCNRDLAARDATRRWVLHSSVVCRAAPWRPRSDTRRR